MKRIALGLVLFAAAACGGKTDSPTKTEDKAAETAAPSQPSAPRARPTLPQAQFKRNVPDPSGGETAAADPSAADPTPNVKMPNDAEKAQRRKDRLANMKNKLDLDGDGKLTVDELAKAEGRMKFDDPAAVDTDHDGVISDEELMAAIKARRKPGRGQKIDSGTAPAQ